MKKIQILALHLSYGGVEKAIIDLANNLSSFYDVEILSTYKIGDKPAYNVSDKVKIKYLIDSMQPEPELFKKYVKSLKLFKAFFLGIKSIKILFLKRKLMVREIKVSNADVLISARIFHNRLLSKYCNINKTRIAWEHNHHQNNKKYFNKVINSASNLDYLVLVSKNLYNDYSKVIINAKCKCVYIPNMIDIKKCNISSLDSKTLINVSRFSKEKGLYDLIDVIEIVRDSIRDIKLNLIGDGPLFDSIKSYVFEKKLENNVVFYGFQNTDFISKCLDKSSLYVMTSFTESFGISLIEAFSHGVPAVAFDSANGACELIGNNELLISGRNKSKMANEIVKLLEDRKTLSRFAEEYLMVSKKYMPSKIVGEWKKIIK